MLQNLYWVRLSGDKITQFYDHGIQIPCSISSKDKFYLRVSRYLDVINLRYAFLEPSLVTFASTSDISHTYCPEIRFVGITFYLYDVITLLWLEGLFFLPLCAGCASNVCHPFRVTKPSDSNFLWHNWDWTTFSTFHLFLWQILHRAMMMFSHICKVQFYWPNLSFDG